MLVRKNHCTLIKEMLEINSQQVDNQSTIKIVARQILFTSQQEDENIKETMLSQYVDQIRDRTPNTNRLLTNKTCYKQNSKPQQAVIGTQLHSYEQKREP